MQMSGMSGRQCMQHHENHCTQEDTAMCGSSNLKIHSLGLDLEQSVTHLATKSRHPRPGHCTSLLCEYHGTTPQTFADRSAFASKMWAQCWPTSDREE